MRKGLWALGTRRLAARDYVDSVVKDGGSSGNGKKVGWVQKMAGGEGEDDTEFLQGPLGG